MANPDEGGKDYKPEERETVLYTKLFYSLDKQEEYGYNTDKEETGWKPYNTIKFNHKYII